MPTGLILRLRGSRFAFALAALAALAVLLISEASYQEAGKTLDALGQRAMAQSEVQSLWRNLSQAESGERGYLLTDRAEYLEPYLQAVGDVRKSLAWLQAHPPSDTASAELASQIERLSVQKLSELTTTLQLYQRGPNDSWRELMLTNIGQEKMDALRDLSNRLLVIESNEIVSGRARVYRTLMLSRIGITAMTALSLLALFLYLRRGAALERQRERQHDLVQAERDRLEVEVATRTASLKELTQHLQTVREDERSHLARELHDELGALLTAAKLDAARLKLRLGAMAPEVAERLAHLNEALNSGIALKRRIIEDLRPSSLSNLGLVSALEILTRDFSAAGTAEIHCDLHPVLLPPASELTVYRLVQEALTNIARHAQASVVHVSLDAHAGKVRASVQDNGVGFDPELAGASYGLLGMRYRVDAAGGELRLITAPGQGTTVEAWLPEAPTGAAPASAGAATTELAPSGI